MITKQTCKCVTKEVFHVWLILLTAMYAFTLLKGAVNVVKRVKETNAIKPIIHLTPDMFQPAEVLDYTKKFCFLKKAVVKQLPTTQIV